MCAVLEYLEVIWPSFVVVEVYLMVAYFALALKVYFALTSKAYFESALVAYFALASKAYFAPALKAYLARAALRVYFAPEVVKPQNLLVRDVNLEVMLRLIHYENYWIVDGKTLVEVAVVDVQASTVVAAAVVAFVVVASFVDTYFDCFHKLYTLQSKTNDIAKLKKFDILRKFIKLTGILLLLLHSSMKSLGLWWIVLRHHLWIPRRSNTTPGSPRSPGVGVAIGVIRHLNKNSCLL